MKNYDVRISEEDSCYVRVAANSADEAENIASEMFCNGDVNFNEYGGVYCEATDRAEETDIHDLRLPMYMEDYLRRKGIHTIDELHRYGILEACENATFMVTAVVWALFENGWIKHAYDLSTEVLGYMNQVYLNCNVDTTQPHR